MKGVYVRSHVRKYNRTYVYTFIYMYTPVCTPYQHRVAVCTHPIIMYTNSRWIFMIFIIAESLRYNMLRAMFLKHMLCILHSSVCDCSLKVVLVVMRCSNDSFVWLSVNSKQNLIRCTSQYRLLDSSLI